MMHRLFRKGRFEASRPTVCLQAVLVSCLVWLGLGAPLAQAAQKTLHINIYGPGQSQLNVYLAPPRNLNNGQPAPVPPLVQDLYGAVRENLEFLPFMRQMKKEELLGEAQVKGVRAGSIDFKRFSMSKTDMLFTLGWSRKAEEQSQVELRSFEIYSQKLFVGRGYVLTSQEQAYEAANRFCAELMDKISGRSGFFRSRLAFVSKQNKVKEIATCTPQGRRGRQITDFGKVCLSPVWSWDGTTLAFSYVNDERHELKIWNRNTEQIRSILLPGNTIISPAFQADGSLVISVDPRGNPDIYRLNNEFRLQEPIVENWAIDISPHFDRQGKHMVFVSSRLGNPHIFRKNLKTGNVERISFEGTYNTNPSISPDGRFVAYSRLTDEGHRIIVYDSETGQKRLLTSGPGNDEDPAWGPDSYFLAFASNRSGRYQIYMTTRHGDEPRKVRTGPGGATSPAWSPVGVQ
jgi:TolB protein